MSTTSSSDQQSHQPSRICSRSSAFLLSATEEVSLLFPQANPSMWTLVPSHHPGLLLTWELSSCHYPLSLLYRQFLHLYNLLPINETLFSSSPSLKTKPTKPLPWPHFSSIYHPISLISFSIKCLNIRSSHFFFSLLLNSLSKITSSLHLTKSVANSV